MIIIGYQIGICENIHFFLIIVTVKYIFDRNAAEDNVYNDILTKLNIIKLKRENLEIKCIILNKLL